MSHILITGSTDGLGRGAAESLLAGGHTVIVHARNEQRAEAVAPLIERGAELFVADLSDREQVIDGAARLNAGTPIDAVIHNAGILSGAAVLPVNVVAPYLFTALLRTPTRHVYLSSGMHRSGQPTLDGLDWSGREATASYSDSKLFVSTLAAAVARRWPDIQSNSVDPGWVATKMGGAGAPDDFDLGYETQARLATDPQAHISGGYWHHSAQQKPHASVEDPVFQARLIDALAAETGVELPERVPSADES